MSLSSCLCVDVEQCNVVELLCDSCYNMNLSLSPKAVLERLIGAALNRSGTLVIQLRR